MSTVAKSSITLTAVNDAYSLSLTPSVCIIRADYDGSNPVLTNAYTLVSLYHGDVKVPIDPLACTIGINFTYMANSSMIDDYTMKLWINYLDPSVREGAITIDVKCTDTITVKGRFAFTVERESTMLDWIQEWESNKTTIGATSIITPKLFVGKKITGSYESLAEVPGLTGVYIGPSSDDSCGLYGYKNSIEIFHLDETGGKIGGWDLLQDGLYSSNGKLRILSDGSIRAVNDEFDTIWETCADGSASFALGNVKFYANGDAEFAGRIDASSGQIAGWTITTSQLHCIPISLSAGGKYIAVANITSYPTINGEWDGDHFDWVKEYGGAAMYYVSRSNFGFFAYNASAQKVFSAGSTNYIAGWSFDNNAIWRGTKNNNADQYTDGIGSLTIGTAGLRGSTWYIDSDGTVSFVKGLVTFGETTGVIAGWTFIGTKFANDNVAIASTQNHSGIYLTSSTDGKFIDRSPDAMENFINLYGGIFLKAKSNSTNLAAYDTNGYQLMHIKSGGISYIAGWKFSHTTLYTGTQVTSGLAADGDITLGPTGLRGYGWRLENDGSGALAREAIGWNANGAGYIANGHISWNEYGNVTLSSSVKISWNNLGGTIIDSNGIFAGKISANNITAGTISTADIKNSSDSWHLYQNGSGHLANGNIRWNEYGDVTFGESVLAQWGQGVNVAQMIAFGTMLYRDPEFTKDKQNSTQLYQNNAFDYCTFSASRLLVAIQDHGLILRGTALVTQVDIVHSNGTVNTLFSGSTRITTSSSINITGPYDVISTDTVRISYIGEDVWMQAESYDEDSNSLGWLNLCGMDSIIGTEVITTRREMIDDEYAPNSTQKVVKYTNTRFITPTDLRLGGFYFANTSRPNGKYVVRFVANLPVGWYFEINHNQHGTGAKDEWVTTKSGTGNYQEYICVVTCGSTGTFNTINYFAVKCDEGYTAVAPSDKWESGIKYTKDGITYTISTLEWYLAYATVYDVTSSDRITTTIDSHGIYTGTLRADQIIAGTLDAKNISADVIISNGNAWALNKDGSGYLANSNIKWNKDGSLVEINGKITALSGKISSFSIESGYIYNWDSSIYNEDTAWTTSNRINMCQIGPNYVRMSQSVKYALGDVAYQKIGIGAGSDPTQSYSSDTYCASALYIHRRMNSMSNMYFPAAQIISDNVVNRNIGLRVVGGVQVHGGLIEIGNVMEYTGSGSATLLDLSFGTTFVLINKDSASSHDFYFPSLSEVRKQIGISDTSQSFCVPITVICGSGSNMCAVSSQIVTSNPPSKAEAGSIVNNDDGWDYGNNSSYGNNRIALGRGDVWLFALIYTPSSGYYIQKINSQT